MKTDRKLRIRKSIRNLYLITSVTAFVISISCALYFLCKNNTIVENQEIYNYSNEFKYKYSVNLIENKYIDETILGMEQVYLTDLINSIDINLEYKYSGNKSSHVKYDYEIIGKIEGVYETKGEKQQVWTKNYNLIEKKENSSENGNIVINENLKLNLLEENSLVEEFEKHMMMTIDAKYILVLNVKTYTAIEDKEIINNYTSPIVINLGKNTTEINGDNNQKEIKYVSKQVMESKEDNNIKIVVSIIISVLSACAYVYTFKMTKPINRIKNQYKYELNKILRLCQDQIVQVRTKLDVNANIVDVKDFGEIIKVSEELFMPILYWNSNNDESWFYVMSNNIVYRYILK